jgi:hypothetical protein
MSSVDKSLRWTWRNERTLGLEANETISAKPALSCFRDAGSETLMKKHEETLYDLYVPNLLVNGETMLNDVKYSAPLLLENPSARRYE